MSVIKRRAKLQNLQSINTAVEETGLNSQYFNITDLPEELSSGKTAFLIKGSQFLKDNVQIKLEILDNSGNPVYIEPVKNYKEAGGVRVSIAVYNDTPTGIATLTVLGEIDPAKVDFDIPQEFIGAYNVKYTRTLSINQSSRNTSPIRFYKRPKLDVNETIKGQVTPTASSTGSLSYNTGKVVGTPKQGTEGNN